MYEYYKKILEEHKNDYLFLTRLRIADCLSDKLFTTEELDNLIVAISQYWVDNSAFDDNDLYSIISWVNCNYADFEDCNDYYELLEHFTDSY